MWIQSGSKSRFKVIKFFPKWKNSYVSLKNVTLKQMQLPELCFYTIFSLFMMNNLSFGSVFPSISADFTPPGSGSRSQPNADPMRIRIRIRNTVLGAITYKNYHLIFGYKTVGLGLKKHAKDKRIRYGVTSKQCEGNGLCVPMFNYRQLNVNNYSNSL
jgi:hypothetical protein